MMNLHEAITQKMIVKCDYHGQVVWRCAKCGEYLVYCQGEYMFMCHCNDERMKP